MKTALKTLFFILSVTLVFASCNRVLVEQYIHAEEVLRWEETIAVFDSLNQVEASDAGTLLVTGSSSIRLWDSIQTDLAPYQVMQRGYGGARLNDYNYYADRIIKEQQFKAIVVFIANDICCDQGNRSPEEVLELFKVLVKQIRERNPDTPVCWIEITPTASRWHLNTEIREANALIRDYCEKQSDLNFVPTYEHFISAGGVPDSTLFRSDELHLNRDGYKLWSGIILEALNSFGIEP